MPELSLWMSERILNDVLSGWCCYLVLSAHGTWLPEVRYIFLTLEDVWIVNETL